MLRALVRGLFTMLEFGFTAWLCVCAAERRPTAHATRHLVHAGRRKRLFGCAANTHELGLYIHN